MSDDTGQPSGWWRWQDMLGKLVDRWLTDRSRLIELLRRAESRHLLDGDTLTMIEGALQVSEMHVRDIMVPRSLMVTVPESDDPEELLPLVVESGHSRFPVMDHRHEKVVGILLAKDLLSVIAQGEREDFRLKEILRPAVFVPESKRLNVLLREFRASRNHLAIVIDEYGGPAGLVSIEDVIEQIVGEIDDEYDIEDDDYVRPFRGNRYTVRARMPIEEFNEYFGTALSDEECDTIGGLVIQQLGSQPARGDTIELGEFTFTVLRADKRRVHTLRVTRHVPVPGPELGDEG
jgi:magnesium and cobalt transporter